MHAFPHRYNVTAAATPQHAVRLASEGLPPLASEPPVEFDGPGGYWSPETLLCAALADCFVLSFRSIAAASKVTWTTLDCDVEGTLDRVERVTRFTAFELRVRLTLPAGQDRERVLRVLERAEGACLISNSLNATTHLVPEIVET